jgi:hypothetical protein
MLLKQRQDILHVARARFALTEPQSAVLEQQLSLINNLSQLEGLFEDSLRVADLAAFQAKLSERVVALARANGGATP